jgi:hypothetical protein
MGIMTSHFPFEFFGQHKAVVFAASTLQKDPDEQQKSPGRSLPHQFSPDMGHDPSRLWCCDGKSIKDEGAFRGLSGSSIEKTLT